MGFQYYSHTVCPSHLEGRWWIMISKSYPCSVYSQDPVLRPWKGWRSTVSKYGKEHCLLLFFILSNMAEKVGVENFGRILSPCSMPALKIEWKNYWSQVSVGHSVPLILLLTMAKGIFMVSKINKCILTKLPYLETVETTTLGVSCSEGNGQVLNLSSDCKLK